jgi:hypothetical protein
MVKLLFKVYSNVAADDTGFTVILRFNPLAPEFSFQF